MSPVFCWLLLAGWLGGNVGGLLRAESADAAFPLVTNVVQLRALVSQTAQRPARVRLEGVVCAANPARGLLVLQDNSGTELLELPLGNGDFQPGQRLQVAGDQCEIIRRSEGLEIGSVPLIDNNGIHGMSAASGSRDLAPGRHALRLTWYNAGQDFGLALAWQPPGGDAQPVPPEVLTRPLPPDGGGPAQYTNGLDYLCVQGEWNMLPNFRRLQPVKTGVVTNFDLGVRSRDERVGLEFTGFLQIATGGHYNFSLTSDDGSQLFVDEIPPRWQILGSAAMPPPTRLTIGQLLSSGEESLWAEIEGSVTFVEEQADGWHFELTSGVARMRVTALTGAGRSSPVTLKSRVRFRGFCRSARDEEGHLLPGVLTVLSAWDQQVLPADTAAPADRLPLPLLTTAEQVQRLKRGEAEWEFPVKLRGVVTATSESPEFFRDFVLQDATRGVFIKRADAGYRGPRADLPQLGEYCEVTGVTGPGDFAPIVYATNCVRLGLGRLPEPLHPAWDELINGSLDSQYLEIQGLVTAVESNTVTLLMHGGTIKVRLIGRDAVELAGYANTLVRIRGCLITAWDAVTHQLRVGEIKISDPQLSVDKPAQNDRFDLPLKSAGDLLLFDPQAGVFQRVKVAGQVVQSRQGEYFMMNGTNGLRFIPKAAAGLFPGALVEVVGFPVLGGPSPVLHEAIVRKTGSAPLVSPVKISPDDLYQSGYDATRVTITGILVQSRPEPGGQVLEMQAGLHQFLARFSGGDEFLPALTPGSLLELTGVYVGQGGNLSLHQPVDSFELLLTTPADIQVLARAPWWNLRRTLTVLTVLFVGLLIAVAWIQILRRQVGLRTAQLEQQIQARAIAQERARVAQDLHDELGNGLTEISLLGSLAGQPLTSADQRQEYVGQMTDKARSLVAALDEIVWAVNPRHDSLGSVGTYFGLCAQRFLELTGIQCQLEVTGDLPEQSMDPRQRHELLLAFKEALNNVAQHSQATEVRLQIGLEQSELFLVVADNGRGLGSAVNGAGMDGLANMRQRLKQAGGHCDITSEPGRGTTIRFFLPLK